MSAQQGKMATSSAFVSSFNHHKVLLKNKEIATTLGIIEKNKYINLFSTIRVVLLVLANNGNPSLLMKHRNERGLGHIFEKNFVYFLNYYLNCTEGEQKVTFTFCGECKRAVNLTHVHDCQLKDLPVHMWNFHEYVMDAGNIDVAKQTENTKFLSSPLKTEPDISKEEEVFKIPVCPETPKKFNKRNVKKMSYNEDKYSDDDLKVKPKGDFMIRPRYGKIPIKKSSSCNEKDKIKSPKSTSSNSPKDVKKIKFEFKKHKYSKLLEGLNFDEPF